VVRKDIEVQVWDNTAPEPCKDGPWAECNNGHIWCQKHRQDECPHLPWQLEFSFMTDDLRGVVRP
jgi:hypothetical protein